MKPVLALTAAALLFTATALHAQATPDSIRKEIGTLRSLPEAERGTRTGSIAKEIATLPDGKPKLGLALGLAHLSTEGDPGRDNLQAVTDTLAAATNGFPVPEANGKPAEPYNELATLARYEEMKVSGPIAQNPQYIAALDKLAKDDEEVSKQDFTAKDIKGKKWTLSQLRGKIVIVNFWATWCPPCRMELPALDNIADKLPNDVVVLALTDEDSLKVQPILSRIPHLTVLFDSDHKAATKFKVNSLPKTFVFDREGKLAAVAIDGRTPRQFVAMLKKAGLKL
ncbi:TlpA family protein disulfide reductase [Granulicella cerasi]|uniref:TlpA family protein disulfide reductase n=1 Tax=Granulicella cerasi TaxID=741063 RepID=A0ABW1ZCP1_9BACT|nr:TlpA disulfide reductase family protein [Granulicella cerasi]